MLLLLTATVTNAAVIYFSRTEHKLIFPISIICSDEESDYPGNDTTPNESDEEEELLPPAPPPPQPRDDSRQQLLEVQIKGQ